VKPGISKNPTTDVEGQAARANRHDFDAAGITVIAVVGPAGSGKTSVIEELLLRMAPPLRLAVMMCDVAADRHVTRITRHGYPAVAVNTDRASAVCVREALSKLDPVGLDLLIIETDGNSISSSEFDLGQHFSVGVFSTAGGDDKANDFPLLVASSDLILLTKTDLLPFVTFDLQAFTQDVNRIKPGISILRVSVHSGMGIKEWLDWTETHRVVNCAQHRFDRIFDPFVSWSRSNNGSTTRDIL
jgi:hydrogenase nickel incorporation protein HypB